MLSTCMLRLALFDLDDTLYHHSIGMGDEIVGRMSRYVAGYLGLSLEEAIELRRREAVKYGTTLEWLRAEKGFVDVEEYFAAVHPEGEEGILSEDPELARVLDAIDLPKAVLTNSPAEHARRVLARLGVADRFEAVYDIRFNELRGKPWPDSYRRSCEAMGARVEDSIFVDDLPKYVRGFLDLGGKAYLIDETGRFPGEDLPRIASLSQLPVLVAELAAGR
jgi:putative hydrolase of the HAD superfamily